jgi:hypothetical protein
VNLCLHPPWLQDIGNLLLSSTSPHPCTYLTYTYKCTYTCTYLHLQDIVNLAISSPSASYYIAPDPNGVYMVLTAADVMNTDGFCTGFCGWHGWYQFNGQYIKYAFVGNPGG